ncbi:MAG: serine/threonine-protein kinase [Polyangiaceae bacterium]
MDSENPISMRWARVVEATSRTPLPMSELRLRAGDLLGEFTLLMKLAQGGMATIWVAARKASDGRPELVAIKTMLPHLCGDHAFVSMFLDEVGLLTAIHHPNVIEVRDVGLHYGLPYVALEWIDGDSLGQLMTEVTSRGEQLPLNVMLRIVGECCLGLHVAHELRNERGELAGVIHRDVSPANIVTGASGDVKLIDFGVATAVDRLSEQTGTGVYKGKVTYMAPEQAMRLKIDRRADVWAAGVVLYRMVTGRTPYQGSMLEVFQQLKLGAPYTPLPRSVPKPLADVIHGALRRDREQRYQTAADFRRGIQFAAAQLCEPLAKDQFAQYVRRYLGEKLSTQRAQILEAMVSIEFT